jgi:type IV secretory pathway VirB4 component
MQVNNADLYFLYTYILLSADDITSLNHTTNQVESILQASGLITRKANFRQEQLYFACSPLMENRKEVKEAARRNVLTNGLLGTFPFISSNICDQNGIFIGTNIYNHSLILMDRFNKEKYKNANMCIFGTSGAGKSFYTKLLLLRYRMLGMKQFVIDPEREYDKICNYVGGLLIKIGPTSSTFINILDIREESIEEGNGYLATKLGKLRGFFGLIFDNLEEEKMAILEEKMTEVYFEKGITFDDQSLYKKDEKQGKFVFKQSEDMPILEDLYNKLTEEENKQLQTKLYPFVFGSLKFLNNRTNIELENELIVADIYELGEDNLKYGMLIFIDLFWDQIKKDRSENKGIYLDEIWRLIGVTSNKNVASFIYKIFKTIRKYGGSAVAITQDISDLFSLEDGIYGKSILNNSSIKSFFSLEEENILVLSKFANISEKEKVEIKSLKRGESLMFIGEDHLLVKIEASDAEKKVIS